MAAAAAPCYSGHSAAASRASGRSCHSGASATASEAAVGSTDTVIPAALGSRAGAAVLRRSFQGVAVSQAAAFDYQTNYRRKLNSV